MTLGVPHPQAPGPLSEADLIRAYSPAETLAIGTALYRAYDLLRPVANTLELEASDPRVRELHARARALRREIGALIVDVALRGAEVGE